jgi:hypothetical protein
MNLAIRISSLAAGLIAAGGGPRAADTGRQDHAVRVPDTPDPSASTSSPQPTCSPTPYARPATPSATPTEVCTNLT